MATAEPVFPRYLRIDRKRSEEYLDPIVKEKESPFYKQEKTSVYLLAAAIGFVQSSSAASKSTTDVRLFADIQKDIKWALFTIAIAAGGGTDILLNGEKTLQIIEEYANGGLVILHEKIFGGSLDYRFENEIIKEIEKVKLS